MGTAQSSTSMSGSTIMLVASEKKKEEDNTWRNWSLK